MVHTPPSSQGASAPIVDRFLPRESGGGYGYGPAPSGLISFQTIRGIIWRQRYIMLGVPVILLVIALVWTLLSKPIYQASATVRYDPPGAEIVEGLELDSFVSTNEVVRQIETLASVVESRTMALKVVDELGLADNADLLGEMVTGGKPANMTEEAWLNARRNAAAGILRGSVSVDTPFDTRIMTISVTSGNPALAARIANGYQDVFVRADIERSIEANSYARDYLEEQIADVRARLQESEVTAIDYARSNRIIATPSEPYTYGNGGGQGSGTAQTIGVASLSSVNQLYVQARADRIAAEQRWRAVASMPAAQMVEVQNNSSLQSLRTSLATMRSRLSELRQRYQDDYPEIRELTAQIASTERDIAQGESEIKNAIRTAYEVAQREEAALAAEVERISGQTLDEQSRRVQYSLLDRDALALREQLSSLMTRYNQINTAANLQLSTITKVDPAVVPGAPISPNLFRNLLAGLAVGLGLALLLALLREVLDNRLRSTDDVETELGVRALGQTPFVKGGVADEMQDPFSPVNEAYSSIRSALDFLLVRRNAKVIQITSGNVGEGKTTSSLALARHYARVGRKVLLIDVDLRRPAALRTAGIERKPELGLVEVLQDYSRLDSALLQLDLPTLKLLPLSGPADNPVLILSSGVMDDLLEKLRPQFDMIILDSSPVLGLADAPLLAKSADAVVLVVEANRAPTGNTRSSLRRLQEMDADIAGVIVTKFRALDAGQAYSYQYQYYSYEQKD